MEGFDRSRLVRVLCVSLVSVVLALALILLVAVCGGDTVTAEGEETTRRSFRPSLPDEPLDPGEISDIFGSGDWGDVTLPPEPDVTLPDWESGMEWPTLPPSLETDPDFEMPTLPEGWDTLPEEWDTLPEEWGDLPIDPDELADLLAGMNGLTGMGAGALAAGMASQLTVMEVYAETTDTLYLKMQSFGDFNGQGWEEAEAYGLGYGQYAYSALYMPHYLMNEFIRFDGYPLTVTPKMDLRVIPYYLTTAGDPGQIQSSDVKAVGAFDEPYTLYYRPKTLYVPADQVNGSLAGYEAAYADFVRQRYLAVDATTLEYLKLIIEEQGFDKNDPYIVEEVAAYIQNAATYNLAYDQNLDREPNVALAFLGAYKEGVCRHYATAATLLYRSLGIPARYTVGFMTDVRAGETTAVKGMDAHAWVEIYEDGFGWRYVEVTGSPTGEDPDDPPETETLPGTGSDTLPGTGGDTEPSEEPVTLPSTWGDIIAGSNGALSFSPSIPPSMLNSTVFTVTAEVDGRLLLKLRSFGDFSGGAFSAAPPCGDLLYDVYSAAYLPGAYLIVKEAARHSLRVESPMGTYAIPYYVDPTAPPEGLTVWDHVVTGDGRKAYTLFYYVYKNDYASKAAPNLVEDSVRAFAYANYLTLDTETADYLAALIAEQGWSGANPAVVETVAEYLRSRYVLGADYELAESVPENAVIAFLKGEIRGGSRHFAAAATLICRALGIPARYTVGYLAEGQADTPVTVQGRDAYAWTEIYVNGFGWMPVDVAQRGATASEDYRITLKPVDMAVRYTGETVEHSGILEGFEVFAAKGYTCEAVVSGRRTQCGVSIVTIGSVKIFDSRGQDVTALFDIERKSGRLTVYLEELTFRSRDLTQVYNGSPMRTHAADLVAGALPEGYSVEIIPAEGGQTRVGVGVAAFDVIVWYDKGGGSLVDRTDWFRITKQYGTHTVTPAPLVLKAYDAEKVYDGTPLTEDRFDLIGGALAEGDSLVSVTVKGSQTRVGRSDNVITDVRICDKDGNDVTGCYAIETVAGVLKVTAGGNSE